MRPPVLDERLSLAASLFPACAYGADIGADHGRLSCYLLETGKAERMCVADISAASLKKAGKLLETHRVSQRADIRVGDGLSVLPQRADVIAILGMGGRTLSGILKSGKDRLQGAVLILSAHTELPLLREAIMELGYTIETEKIAKAAERFYVVLRAVPGEEKMGERQLLLGPRLMETAPAHYADYLNWRVGVASQKRTEAGQKEYQWLKEEYERVLNSGNDGRNAE